MPFIRNCVKPQFWQLFSVLKPGEKFKPSHTVTDWATSNIFGVIVFTINEASRRFFSFLSAVITTCSSPRTSCSSSNFTTLVSSALINISISFGL